MAEVKQTKGYSKIRGKIWKLNNNKLYENDSRRELSFGIQTNKDNSLFVRLGAFKESDKVAIMRNNEFTLIPFAEKDNLRNGDKLIGVSIKSSNDESNVTMVDNEAIDYIIENFKDGDSVFIKSNTEVDLYGRRLKTQIQQIYISSDPIDFTSSGFEENNFLVQTVVITNKDIDGEGNLNVGVVGKNSTMIEIPIKLIQEDVISFFKDSIKVGDVVKVECKMVRKPIYKEGVVEDENTTKKSLIKKKEVASGNRRKDIEGYEEYIEVVDALDSTSKVYSRDDIREALEIGASTKTQSDNNDSVGDDDIPF